eukprot:UN24322
MCFRLGHNLPQPMPPDRCTEHTQTNGLNTCQDQDGTEAANTASCVNEEPATERDCPAAGGDCTWVTDDWSTECDTYDPPSSCGIDESSESRTVSCTQPDGVTIINDTNCDSGSKPAESRTCPEVQACPTWRHALDECATVCGRAAITHTATVVCEDASGNSTEDTDCENKPEADTLDCDATDDCPTT